MGIYRWTRDQWESEVRLLPPTFARADGAVLDTDAAWAEYLRDQRRWHIRTDLNRSGDPLIALVQTDGPWWVPGKRRQLVTV
jgi:hypothetical protein